MQSCRKLLNTYSIHDKNREVSVSVFGLEIKVGGRGAPAHPPPPVARPLQILFY